MKWIEIIRLRAFDQPRQTGVIELLNQLKTELSVSDVTCTLYHHATVETDLSIHLAWDRHPGARQKRSGSETDLSAPKVWVRGLFGLEGISHPSPLMKDGRKWLLTFPNLSFYQHSQPLHSLRRYGLEGYLKNLIT